MTPKQREGHHQGKQKRVGKKNRLDRGWLKLVDAALNFYLVTHGMTLEPLNKEQGVRP